MSGTFTSEGTYQIIKDLAEDMYKKGVRPENISPDSQINPVLINALRSLWEGNDLSIEEVKNLFLSGGTDHPDPTLRSVG